MFYLHVFAGLCHDLGHGPFSHVYDGVFVKKMWPKGIDSSGSKWRHEDGSVRMFNYLLESNKIDIARYGMTERDKLFIEEVIGGVKESAREGRPASKFFLYDIVNNALSGLDVDKLDYFQRDMRMANVKLQADFDRYVLDGAPLSCPHKLSWGFNRCRFIDLARVLPATPIHKVDDGRRLSHGTPSSAQYVNMICYPEKMVHEALNAFATRFHMHMLVYTHRSVKCIEFMITDALEAANQHIFIEGSRTAAFPAGLYRISECIYDMQALSNLKDSILDIIRYEHKPELKKAKEILKRIDNRDLYVCVGTTAFTTKDTIHILSTDLIADELVACAQSVVANSIAGAGEYLSSNGGSRHGLFSSHTASTGSLTDHVPTGNANGNGHHNGSKENDDDDEDSKMFAAFTSGNSGSSNQPSGTAPSTMAMERTHSSSNLTSSSGATIKHDLNLQKDDIIVEKVLLAQTVQCLACLTLRF
jgi:HD superfamily phosphohydrolase